MQTITTKADTYLCISNNGIAPVEALTMLGVTSTRYQSDDLFIGQFGSGAKHAIALLLRMGIGPTIYCGKTKLTFTTEPAVIGNREYIRPVCTVSGFNSKNGGSVTKTEKLGFVLEFGSLEWTNIYMAMREFISNALDASLSTSQDTKSLPHSDVQVKEVEHRQVRAEANKTKVFIPMISNDIKTFIAKLPQYFIHFSKPVMYKPNDSSKEMLMCVSKVHTCKSFEEYKEEIMKRVLPNDYNTKPKIYRKGVFVGEAQTDLQSIFHYNFQDDLAIDESRNIRDYEAKECAAKTVAQYTESQMRKVFNHAIRNEKKWEHTFSEYNVCNGTAQLAYDKEKQIEFEKKVKGALASVFVANDLPADTVICSDPFTENKLRERGINCHTLTVGVSMISHLLGKAGINTGYSYLSEMDKMNYTVTDATAAVLETCDDILRIFNDCAVFSNNKEKPRIKCFSTPTVYGSKTYGLCDMVTNTIFIDTTIAGSKSEKLFSVCLEEMIHAYTKTKDFTRDFQEATFSLLYSVLQGKGKV